MTNFTDIQVSVIKVSSLKQHKLNFLKLCSLLSRGGNVMSRMLQKNCEHDLEEGMMLL